MPTLLQQLAVDEVTMCRRPAVPRARVAVVKSAEATSTSPDMSKAQTVLAALRSAFGVVEKADGEPDDIDTALAEVEAALLSDDSAADPEPPEMPNAALAKQVADLTALQKSLEDREARLITLQKSLEDKEEATAVAKAEADARAMLGSVSGNVTVLASLLRKASPEEREALEASYRSATAIAKSAPVTRFGGLRVVKNGEDSIESIAKGLQEKDPKLTDAAAIAKAAADNPKVYEAEVMAQRAATAAMGV